MMGDTQALRDPKEALAPPQDGVREGFLGTQGERGWSRLEEQHIQRPGRVKTPRGRGPGHSAQGHEGHPL